MIWLSVAGYLAVGAVVAGIGASETGQLGAIEIICGLLWPLVFCVSIGIGLGRGER